MFSRTTIALCVALLLSGMLNYTLFGKNRANDFVIDQQKQSIDDLNKTIKFNGVVKTITEQTFSGVIDATKISDDSFEQLKDKIYTYDKCKKQDVKPVTPKVKADESIPTIDPDVTVYYDILQSAYSLQNKN